MQYFLVQTDNTLVHLPNCRFEEGKREIVEVRQSGGPAVFLQGRKQPDIFVFPVPKGATVSPCVIVDENAIVRRVLVSITEITSHSFNADGVVEDTFEAPGLQEAKRSLSEAIKQLEIK